MRNRQFRSVLGIITTMVKLRRMDIHLFHRTTENIMSIIEATMMIGCLRHTIMVILLHHTIMDTHLLLIGMCMGTHLLLIVMGMGTPLLLHHLLHRLLEVHRSFIAARTPCLRRVA
jgi:hypothetical protein